MSQHSEIIQHFIMIGQDHTHIINGGLFDPVVIDNKAEVFWLVDDWISSSVQ